MGRRFHFSAKAFVLETKVTRHVNGSFGNNKPNGLWYSIGNSWKDWCSYEAFRLETFQYKTRLLINTNKLLQLNSIKAINEFTDTYSIDPYITRTFRSMCRINWDAVAEKYAGIEISPQQGWQRLNGATWYYGWDCASGCVWDTSIVHACESMCQCIHTDAYKKHWSYDPDED